jgi:hypothetical protein
MMITLNDIKVEPYEDDGYSVTLLTTDDVGIKYRYKGVSFGEDNANGSAELSFEYELISGEPRDKEKFHQTIGDVLVLLIENMLKSSNVVYANGID